MIFSVDGRVPDIAADAYVAPDGVGDRRRARWRRRPASGSEPCSVATSSASPSAAAPTFRTTRCCTPTPARRSRSPTGSPWATWSCSTAATSGEDSLIGIGAIVMNHARIGARSHRRRRRAGDRRQGISRRRADHRLAGQDAPQTHGRRAGAAGRHSAALCRSRPVVPAKPARDLSGRRRGSRRGSRDLRSRIRPSCASEATSTPSSVKTWPRASPRAPDEFGLSRSNSSHSSTRSLAVKPHGVIEARHLQPTAARVQAMGQSRRADQLVVGNVGEQRVMDELVRRQPVHRLHPDALHGLELFRWRGTAPAARA